jgi:GNAT superfamily N-acetyltransferase
MENVVIRRMAESDVPAGMRLRELAGWNQTEQDWRRFLRLEPDGCFVACDGQEICGTVTTLKYGERFGWIGMILVDPAKRGRGIGTHLLKRGMECLQRAAVETLKLDATPMGLGLYKQLGFVEEYGIERWEGVARGSRGAVLPPVKPEEIQYLCAWDREAFGADRTRLLASIWDEGPEYSALVRSGREIAGYMLGRAGSRAHYLGPWVSTVNAEAAERLFQQFMRRFDGQRVFVDVYLGNSHARSLVETAGFVPQRPLTRMYLGPNRYPGRPQLVCGIAGPELG